MKLIFLHGAPGAGKLTTAKALLHSVPGRLFDNHAAIDVARTVFDFGTSGFWELVQSVRMSVLRAAAKNAVPLVVMTFVYVDPDDLPVFEQFESILQQHDGELFPVFLQCSTAEIVRRIDNADRRNRGKLTSEQGVRDFLARHRVTPVLRSNCLVVNSENSSAEVAAHEIIRHLKLAPSRIS